MKRERTKIIHPNKERGKGEKIHPEEYRKILNGVDLRAVALQSSSTRLKRENYDVTDLIIKIDRDSSFSYIEDGIVEVKERYKLIAQSKKKKKQAINISCTFGLIFSTSETFGEDFFEVFQAINLPLNSWPYFREFVQNMTQRMNIPPLTLPFKRR